MSHKNSIKYSFSSVMMIAFALLFLSGCNTLNSLPNSQLGRSGKLLTDNEERAVNIERAIVAIASDDGKGADTWMMCP